METTVFKILLHFLSGSENAGVRRHFGSGLSCLDVWEVVVELAQVVVFLIVQSGKDAAAGQLWQILERK